MRKSKSIHFKISVTILLTILVAYVAVPSFAPPLDHGVSPKSTCIANLRQIDSAKEQWAIDNHKPAGSKVTFHDLVGSTLYTKVTPTCPLGGAYVVNRIGDDPTCTCEGHKIRDTTNH